MPRIALVESNIDVIRDIELVGAGKADSSGVRRTPKSLTGGDEGITELEILSLSRAHLYHILSNRYGNLECQKVVHLSIVYQIST